MENQPDPDRRHEAAFVTVLTASEWTKTHSRIQRLAKARGVDERTIVRHVLWQGLTYWEERDAREREHPEDWIASLPETEVPDGGVAASDR